MKKGRPGTKISVMVPENRMADVAKFILRETTTLGIRVFDCESVHLEREIETVTTPWGEVRVKIAKLDGNVVNVAPEFDDCKAIAERNAIPLKKVHPQVMRLFPVLSPNDAPDNH